MHDNHGACHLLKRYRYKIVWNCGVTEYALSGEGINQFRETRDNRRNPTCESRFLYDAVSCAPPRVNDGRKSGHVRPADALWPRTCFSQSPVTCASARVSQNAWISGSNHEENVPRTLYTPTACAPQP